MFDQSTLTSDLTCWYDAALGVLNRVLPCLPSLASLPPSLLSCVREKAGIRSVTISPVWPAIILQCVLVLVMSWKFDDLQNLSLINLQNISDHHLVFHPGFLCHWNLFKFISGIDIPLKWRRRVKYTIVFMSDLCCEITFQTVFLCHKYVIDVDFLRMLIYFL